MWFDRKNVIQISNGRTTNVDVSVKNVMHLKEDYIWNPATCSSKNGKNVASIMDDSANTCDEIVEKTKTISTNFNKNI